MGTTSTTVPVPVVHERTRVQPYGSPRPRAASRVSVGAFAAEAPTQGEARAALAERVAAYAVALDECPFPRVVSYGGTTYVVSVVPDETAGFAWCTQRLTAGGRTSASMGDAGRSLDDVLARARYSLAQEHTAWADDASVAESCAWLGERSEYGAAELRGYAGFQRAYLAVPAGEPDPHRWACEHAREHEPARVSAGVAA